MYWFVCAVLRLIFAPVCRCRVWHGERSREPGAWILAANHISHFDPPLLSLSTGRHIHWMAMEELFRGRLLGWILRHAGAFPVRRGRPDRSALRTAVELLQGGKVVGIFPEGGIRDGSASLLQGGELRPGLALVAGMAHVPVRPVVILGSDRLYASRRWWHWRGTPIWIGFGELLEMKDSVNERELFEERLRQALRELAQDTAAHFGLQAEDWPRSPQQRMQEG